MIVLKKCFRVIVKAYHTQIVPKHTKIFESEEQAVEYKEILSKEVIWNTAVSVEIEHVFMVQDTDTTDKNFLLEGEFVRIDDVL